MSAPTEDEKRDPVEILKHAQKYLVDSRGALRAHASEAMRILGDAEIRAAGCIDHMIGETLRRKGLRCPCEFHQREAAQELQLAASKPAPRRHIRNGKEAAAGERDDT
jgi:hypothetical protein